MTLEPEFKRRLQEARTRLSEQIVISLHANSLDAIHTLRKIMLDNRASASVRVAAASRLIEVSLKAKNQLDLEQRRADLEHALHPRKNDKKGHASITLTLDTYSHVLPSMQHGASDKLERILYG